MKSESLVGQVVELNGLIEYQEWFGGQPDGYRINQREQLPFSLSIKARA